MQRNILLVGVVALALASCTYTNSRDSLEEPIQRDLSALLAEVQPVQPITPKVTNEVRVPRNAPWLSNGLAAQYRDRAREAIQIVLAGRPAIFPRDEEDNPIVSSPFGASTIKDHLDAISIQADWSYTISDGVVIFSDSETRQFSIHTMPGVGLSRLPLGSFDQQRSGGATNNFDLSFSPYRDLETSVAALIADYSRGLPARSSTIYSLEPFTNTLTVSGPPSLLRRVSRLVESFNAAAGSKVHLSITVYDVSFSDSTQRSIDFDLLRQAAITSAASFQGSGLVQTVNGGLSLGLDFFEGNSLDSSTLIFNLLQQQGTTSVKLHEAFEALNNMMFSIEDQRTTPYVSKVSVDRQDGGSISSLTPSIELDELITGLGFHVVSTISGDTIMLRLALSQSDLVRFDPYKYGTGENQLSGSVPVSDGHNRIIPIILKDGETRLIANLSQSQSRNDESGSGFGFIGRSNAVNNSQTQTVIAVTAKIL